MDFLRWHCVAWGWWTGELVFQDEDGDHRNLLEWVCYIQETQEVLPGSVQCLQVGLDPPPNVGDLIHLQTAEWKNLRTGAKACDAAGVAMEGETLILVEN